VKQVAAALEYLHTHQVLHRNLRPDHLLVGHRQQLLVCGFGVALQMQPLSFQEKQEVVGTLTYLAPEQLQGRPVPTSDQYALGSIVYEWLTGEPPFRGLFTVISEQISHASPPPVSAKRADIPSAIEHVVMMALKKQPEQRVLNMMAFANALEQARGRTT
jgi:serine/threonine protein kinase